MKNARCDKRSDGFTVIELMIVVVVIAVLASVIGPTFEEYFTKQRLKQAVEDVQGLMQEAKSEAIVRGRDMYVDIDTSGTWCIGYSSVAGCDCQVTSGSDLCSIDAIISSGTVAITKRLTGADYADVSLASNFSAPPSFDSVNSVPSNLGTLKLQSSDWKAEIRMSRLGRVFTCDDSTVNTLGYQECPP